MKHHQGLTYPEVEKLLSQWVGQAILSNVVMNGDVICKNWKELTRLFKIPSSNWLNLLNGWLGRFEQRIGLRASVRHSEGVAAGPKTIAHEVSWCKLITSDYALKDIFNMDKTSLFYVYIFFYFFLISNQVIVSFSYQDQVSS